MQFKLLDHVEQIVPGESLVAVKNLSLAEEYLADHFPRAPVLPGVMMLQALVEAARWVILVGEDFATGVPLLRQVRSVKFARFVDPGEKLVVEVRVLQREGDRYTVQGTGSVQGSRAVSARLVLQCCQPQGPGSPSPPGFRFLQQWLRQQWSLLQPPQNPQTPKPPPREETIG